MYARAVGAARPIVAISVDPLLKKNKKKLPESATGKLKKAKKIIEKLSENVENGKKMKKRQKTWGMQVPHHAEAMIQWLSLNQTSPLVVIFVVPGGPLSVTFHDEAMEITVFNIKMTPFPGHEHLWRYR
jgi:hypothetical protein